jgi:hypothetical protein
MSNRLFSSRVATLASIGLVSLVPSAWAQSSVTVFGIADLARLNGTRRRGLAPLPQRRRRGQAKLSPAAQFRSDSLELHLASQLQHFSATPQRVFASIRQAEFAGRAMKQTGAQPVLQSSSRSRYRVAIARDMSRDSAAALRLPRSAVSTNTRMEVKRSKSCSIQLTVS